MRLISISFFLLLFLGCYAQPLKFQTSDSQLSIKINGEIVSQGWQIAPEINPDLFLADCPLEQNVVTFLDSNDSISFNVAIGDTVDFVVVLNEAEPAFTRIIGVQPNVLFTPEYISQNKGQVSVQIPEVSELANILVALHKDAKQDDNMTDIHTDYFQKVRTYFKPYIDHPIIDTIQKYIGDLRYVEAAQDSFFSDESYGYYYALKMNACSYYFDPDNNIVNNGVIREMARGWYYFDPMKDVDLMVDFARKSNFRAFYNQNKPYYDSLLTTYNQLNPIGKMQQWLDKKFGFTYGNYSIYFSPLVYGAHSTQKFQSGGFNQTFMFICKAEYLDNYSKTMNELLESRVVFTEIDHNYVNPTSDKFLDRINAVFANLDIWAQKELTSMYDNPYRTFNEYMTFAIYTLYVADNYSEEALLEFLPKMEDQMENGRGFIKFKAFNRELLQKYQADKTISIDELYRHILNWSEKQS